MDLLRHSKPWLIGLALLLLLNNLAQFFSPRVLNSLKEWDESMIFTIFSSSKLGAELGTQTFATYGPAMKYMGWPVGIDSPEFPLGLILFVSFYLWCTLRFCQNSNLTPLSCLILIMALFLFNVPSIRYAPWILFVWSLGHHSEKKVANCVHESFGIVFVVFLFLYKASWGIIGILHLLIDAFLNQRFRFKSLATRSIFLLIGIPLFYYLITEQGSLQSLAKYFWYSIEDSSDYVHNNNSPLELHFISSAWTDWQESFHHWLGPNVAVKILKYFPLFFWASVLIAACRPFKNKYYWLAFPVLLGEYKHSYVRADVTNLHGIFFIIPLYLFILSLKFSYHSFKGKLLVSSLLIWTSMEIFGFFPYNIPRRHPRDFWLDNLWALNDPQKIKQEIPEITLNEKLAEFKWVSDRVADKTLLSIPARNDLALLGKPYMLPSHQSYYTMEGQMRNKDDLTSLKKVPPGYILFEDRLEFFRAGSSIQTPSILNQLLTNYHMVDGQENFILFEKLPESKRLLRTKLSDLNFDHGIGVFEGELTPNSVLYLKSQKKQNLKNKIWAFLMKGARLHISIREQNEERTFDISIDDLSNGIVLFRSLDLSLNREDIQPFTLKFHGSSFSKYPHEMTEEILNDVNFHGILEKWTWSDNPD